MTLCLDSGVGIRPWSGRRAVRQHKVNVPLDPFYPTTDNKSMETKRSVPLETVQGRPDPAKMKEAAERMDQLREEIREKSGIQDISAKLVRESRGYTDNE